MATNQLLQKTVGANYLETVTVEKNSIGDLLKNAERLGFSKQEISELNAKYAKVFTSYFQ